MVRTIDDLISIASKLVSRIDLGNDSDAGTVAAALESRSGQIYTGICLDLACGIGACAEHSAVVEMLKHGEREIIQIVAVNSDGVLIPCGRCRELMLQVSPSNGQTTVHVSVSESMRLRELLPYHWLE